MPREPNWEAAVKKLAEQTEAGMIKWSQNTRVASLRKQVHGDGYEAVVQGRHVLVYEYRYRDFIDSEEYEWEDDVAIEFVTPQLELEYRWPATPYRRYLLDSIRYQVSGADKFLERFLSEEATSS
jgi:hypothetical protein